MKTKMKIFLGLLVIFLIITSCNKDDDDTISGTYVLTELYTSSNDEVATSENLVDGITCLKNVLTFNDDNTFTYSFTDIIVDLDTDGNETVNCEAAQVRTGTYASNGNSLIFSTADETFELNDSNVTITLEEIRFAIDESTIGKLVYVFDRQE